MLNKAGERSEQRKFCISNHQIWKNSEIRKLFLFFFADFRGGGQRLPTLLWIRRWSMYHAEGDMQCGWANIYRPTVTVGFIAAFNFDIHVLM